MSVKTILYVEGDEGNRRPAQDLLMPTTYPSLSPECGEPTT
jgi:hypothetical protein